ncbi:hypothetical protein BDW22DRAFT_608111 [Trametopsis cervina]|nr:hypothetical protein BDW22DRAFT_608111 [Trametopsis cervina]
MSANKLGRKSVPAISGPLGPVPPAPKRRIATIERRTTDQIYRLACSRRPPIGRSEFTERFRPGNGRNTPLCHFGIGFDVLQIVEYSERKNLRLPGAATKADFKDAAINTYRCMAMLTAVSHLEKLCGADLKVVTPLSPTYAFMIEIYNNYNMHEEGFIYASDEQEVINVLERELSFDGWDAEVMWYWNIETAGLYAFGDDAGNDGEGLPEEEEEGGYEDEDEDEDEEDEDEDEEDEDEDEEDEEDEEKEERADDGSAHTKDGNGGLQTVVGCDETLTGPENGKTQVDTDDADLQLKSSQAHIN